MVEFDFDGKVELAHSYSLLPFVEEQKPDIGF